MPHPHHSLSPSLTSYTKSPIPTIVGHTNNVSNAYSCSTPFGLKSSLDGGLLVASASPATPTASSVVSGGVNSCVGQNIVPGLGPVSGISVITSMGSNSASNSGATGIGEGPPTPTQELDLSGSVLDQQAQQAAAVAAAAAAAAAGMSQQLAAQQRGKCKS